MLGKPRKLGKCGLLFGQFDAVAGWFSTGPHILI